jgi:hypothetical protein
MMYGSTVPERRSSRLMRRFHFFRARATCVELQPEDGGEPSQVGPLSCERGSPRRWFGFVLTR